MTTVAHDGLSAPAIPAPRAETSRLPNVPPFRVRKAGLGYSGDNVYGVPILLHPTASAIAEDVLSWLEETEERPVLDPDSRVWFGYHPAKGFYTRVPGTAEQAARVLIRQAAQACEQWKRDGWKSARDMLTGEAPLFFGALPVSGRQPTLDDIARALVDISCSAEVAAEIRKRMAAGRAPNVMFNPLTRDADGGWSDDWEGNGIPLGRPEATPIPVPVRAANYAPALITFQTSGGGWDCTIPPAPGFDRLCELVWPGPAVRDAALRSLAMGFTGRATKYVVYWSSETGRGKSLMAALMSDLLGGYARSVPAKSLFGHLADPQRAAEELAGCWLAVVEEGIGDQSFKADSAFKLVTTGGGDLNARKLYQESRQVAATHTILLAVNPEAGLNYADPAICARLCPIRFDGDPAAIAAYAEHYNPAAEAWKAEAPAVLAKMLEYARDFWAGRWKPFTLADVMAYGTAEAIGDDLAFAVEMKTGTNVGTFIDGMRRVLAADADGHGARDLYRRYVQWAALNGRETVTETAFGRALGQCDGVTRARERSGTVYRVAPATGQ